LAGRFASFNEALMPEINWPLLQNGSRGIFHNEALPGPTPEEFGAAAAAHLFFGMRGRVEAFWNASRYI
jgi:hypothetical protein